MLRDKPATRKSLLEMLERPENADLKKKVTKDPEYTDIILDAVLMIDATYDSFEDFKKDMEAYEQNKKTVYA